MHPAHKQQRQQRLVLTLWVPLDKRGCLNRSTQDRADISPQSLVSFQHFNETEERCYKCFLATAPRERFPLHSVSSPRWELPPSLSHGLQQCTTCLVPETHSNSPDSSSCLLFRSAPKDNPFVCKENAYFMEIYCTVCCSSISRWSLNVYTWRKILSMLLVFICHLASLESKCLASLSDRRRVV